MPTGGAFFLGGDSEEYELERPLLLGGDRALLGGGERDTLLGGGLLLTGGERSRSLLRGGDQSRRLGGGDLLSLLKLTGERFLPGGGVRRRGLIGDRRRALSRDGDRSLSLSGRRLGPPRGGLRLDLYRGGLESRPLGAPRGGGRGGVRARG